jgi:ABC-type nitrate/sulfonate/bicarbonate transport system permease component
MDTRAHSAVIFCGCCSALQFPAIFGSFRILYDIGWTYVILAEMVNARKGVGYMVEAARKVLDFDRVYAGIIAIGVAAFLFRFLLTFLEARLFPWRRLSAPAAAHD